MTVIVFQSLNRYQLDKTDILGSGKFVCLDELLPKLKGQVLFCI